MGRSRRRQAEPAPPPKREVVRFRDARSKPILLACIPATIAGGVVGAVAGGPVGAIAGIYFVFIAGVVGITRLEKARKREE